MAKWYIRHHGGSDSNGGHTPADAWKTFKNFNVITTPVQAGDTVYVGAGSYHALTVVSNEGSIHPTKNFGGAVTIFADRNGDFTGDGGEVAVEEIRYIDHLIVDGFVVTKFNVDSTAGGGSGTFVDGEIKNCIIHGTVRITRPSGTAKFINNVVGRSFAFGLSSAATSLGIIFAGGARSTDPAQHWSNAADAGALVCSNNTIYGGNSANAQILNVIVATNNGYINQNGAQFRDNLFISTFTGVRNQFYAFWEPQRAEDWDFNWSIGTNFYSGIPTSTPVSTGRKSPTAATGTMANPTNIFSSNDIYAVADAAGETAIGSVFAFGVPAGNIPSGIIVRAEADVDTIVEPPGDLTLQARLSWNGGLNWTSPKSLTVFGSNPEQYYLFGSSTDRWGMSWLDTFFSDSNFRVEITATNANGTTKLNLDHVDVEAFSVPNPRFIDLIFFFEAAPNDFKYADLSSWQTDAVFPDNYGFIAAKDGGSIEGNPLVDSDKVHLTDSSPCIGRASSFANNTTDFEVDNRGLDPDIGADEHFTEPPGNNWIYTSKVYGQIADDKVPSRAFFKAGFIIHTLDWIRLLVSWNGGFRWWEIMNTNTNKFLLEQELVIPGSVRGKSFLFKVEIFQHANNAGLPDFGVDDMSRVRTELMTEEDIPDHLVKGMELEVWSIQFPTELAGRVVVDRFRKFQLAVWPGTFRVIAKGGGKLYNKEWIVTKGFSDHFARWGELHCATTNQFTWSDFDQQFGGVDWAGYAVLELFNDESGRMDPEPAPLKANVRCGFCVKGQTGVNMFFAAMNPRSF